MSDESTFGMHDRIAALRPHWRTLVLAPVIVGALAVVGSFLIRPTFESTVTFLPPQQNGGAASALASLGALAGLAGGLGSAKSPAEQFGSLMQSDNVTDRLVDRYKLMEVYDVEYRFQARKELHENTEIEIGKKDGIISVKVADHDVRRAAAIANDYVDELRRMTTVLAISEAQQRRVFFEKQLQDSKTKLATAQQALQDSGFNAGALKAEPKAAADTYARLKAQLTEANIRLSSMRTSLAETSPDVRRQLATIDALQRSLAETESTEPQVASSPDYVTRYREFKYQETLFDLMAKQYELARVDESREGALIQVIDVAKPAEHKSKPKRALIGLEAAILAEMLALAWLALKRPNNREGDHAIVV